MIFIKNGLLRYKQILNKRPVLTASLSSGLISFTSDYICQIFIEKNCNKPI